MAPWGIPHSGCRSGNVRRTGLRHRDPVVRNRSSYPPLARSFPRQVESDWHRPFRWPGAVRLPVPRRPATCRDTRKPQPPSAQITTDRRARPRYHAWRPGSWHLCHRVPAASGLSSRTGCRPSGRDRWAAESSARRDCSGLLIGTIDQRGNNRAGCLARRPRATIGQSLHGLRHGFQPGDAAAQRRDPPAGEFSHPRLIAFRAQGEQLRHIFQ